MHRKGGEMTVFFVNWHLPETRGEVDGGEDGQVGSANVTHALIHFVHGVFVRVSLHVEALEVLDNSEATTTFLWNTEDGGIVGRLSAPYNPHSCRECSTKCWCSGLRGNCHWFTR